MVQNEPLLKHFYISSKYLPLDKKNLTFMVEAFEKFSTGPEKFIDTLHVAAFLA